VAVSQLHRTIRDSAISFELLRHHLLEEHKALKERVFDVTTETVSNLVRYARIGWRRVRERLEFHDLPHNCRVFVCSDVSKRADNLDSSVKGLQSEIASGRSRMHDAWAVYERAATDSIKLAQEGKVRGESSACGRVR
jgi:hypothetical protein